MATRKKLRKMTTDPKADKSTTLEVLGTAAQMQAALVSERAALVARIETIESLLGFVAASDDLNVRVAKLEKFVGV
jgi:hypothetical protein